MSQDLSKEFVASYHAAVFEALGADADKYNVKIGILLASHLLKKLNQLPENKDEFKVLIEDYLSGAFKFADIAKFTFNNDGSAYLYIKGCVICQGNEILRNQKGRGFCPICHLVKSSLAKSLKMKVELVGSEKPGPVGECYLKYRVE
ncbi:MAG: hypothetical protein ACM3SY_08555 [Candidatus Omnitrophota bacterium]